MFELWTNDSVHGETKCEGTQGQQDCYIICTQDIRYWNKKIINLQDFHGFQQWCKIFAWKKYSKKFVKALTKYVNKKW